MQYVFSFFVVASYGVRRSVESLCRFNPDRVSVGGKHIEGKLRRIEYEDWLRWYSPLCERGAQ